MFAPWPARLYTKFGEYLQTETCIFPQHVLVSDDYRVFVRKCVLNGVIYFHEADPVMPADRKVLAETFGQLVELGL